MPVWLKICRHNAVDRKEWSCRRCLSKRWLTQCYVYAGKHIHMYTLHMYTYFLISEGSIQTDAIYAVYFKVDISYK